MDLSQLQREAFATALAREQFPAHPTTTDVCRALMHAVCELGEVFQELDRGVFNPRQIRYDALFGQVEIPKGVPIELADVVICIASIAGALGIDLAGAVTQKLAVNRARIPRAQRG